MYTDPSQSALPQDVSTVVAESREIGIPVTQTIVDLLTTIMEHTEDLKGLAVNKVLRMWPSHYKQFGIFVTKMSDKDRETLQIVDPKVIQGKIDTVPQEKALQATADEKVDLGQLVIHQGLITEANLEAIELPTVKAKANIKSALSLMEEAKAALYDLELGHVARKLHRRLHRTMKNPQVCLGSHPDSYSCQCWS